MNISNNDTANDNDNILVDESFNKEFMHIPRNKWRNNKNDISSEDMHEI